MKRTQYITAVRDKGLHNLEYRRVWLGDDGHHYVKLDGEVKDITGTILEKWMTLDEERDGVSRQIW